MFEDEDTNNIDSDANPENEPSEDEFEEQTFETANSVDDKESTDSKEEQSDDENELSEEEEAEKKRQEEIQNKTVTVQPVQFASFEDFDQVQGTQNQNLNILLDVKLQLSVELGKTELPIKKLLELTKGSIVTLNKAAGEPVELYANGKLIAYGEVVVIEDNFGLRITHITDPVKRLNTLNGGKED